MGGLPDRGGCGSRARRGLFSKRGGHPPRDRREGKRRGHMRPTSEPLRTGHRAPPRGRCAGEGPAPRPERHAASARLAGGRRGQGGRTRGGTLRRADRSHGDRRLQSRRTARSRRTRVAREAAGPGQQPAPVLSTEGAAIGARPLGSSHSGAALGVAHEELSRALEAREGKSFPRARLLGRPLHLGVLTYLHGARD